MARRIGGQYFPGQGEKRRTARRARMKQAETVQRQAQVGPGGYMGGQAMSNANRVAQRLLGSPGAGGYNLVAGGGGGGGGGGYGSDYDEARAANLKRYGEIKGGYEDRYKRGMGTLDQIGAQEKADIIERGRKAATVGQQNMVSRGLTASTIAPSVARGYAKDTEAELRRFADSQARLRLGTDASLSGDTLGFMERREDFYPDLSQYINTAQAYGASGGGQPAFYGGYQVPGAGYFNVGGGSGQPQRPRPGPGFVAEGPQPGGGGGPGANPDIVQRPGGFAGDVGGGAGQPVARGGSLQDIQRGLGRIPGLPPHLRGLSREELLRRFPDLIRQLENAPVTRGGYMA